MMCSTSAQARSGIRPAFLSRKAELRIRCAGKSLCDRLPNARAQMERGRAYRRVFDDSLHARSKLHWCAINRAPGTDGIQKGALCRNCLPADGTTTHMRLPGCQFAAAKLVVQVKANATEIVVTGPHFPSLMAAVRSTRSTEAVACHAPAPGGTSRCRPDNAKYRRSRDSSSLQTRAVR